MEFIQSSLLLLSTTVPCHVLCVWAISVCGLLKVVGWFMPGSTKAAQILNFGTSWSERKFLWFHRFFPPPSSSDSQPLVWCGRRRRVAWSGLVSLIIIIIFLWRALPLALVIVWWFIKFAQGQQQPSSHRIQSSVVALSTGYAQSTSHQLRRERARMTSWDIHKTIDNTHWSCHVLSCTWPWYWSAFRAATT